MMTASIPNLLVIFLLGILLGITTPQLSRRTFQLKPPNKENIEATVPTPALFSKEINRQIADKLTELIQQQGRIDEVEICGRYYLFDTRINEEHHNVYTGVEHMGARESFTETDYELSRFECLGVYDKTGDEISTGNSRDTWEIRQMTETLLNAHS